MISPAKRGRRDKLKWHEEYRDEDGDKYESDGGGEEYGEKSNKKT